MKSIDLPSFSLGTWSMGGGDSWGYSDERESRETLSMALDLGVKWIDTAPAYGNGLSETLLGETLKERRKEIILSTKVGLTWEEEGSRVHIRRDGLTIYRNLRKDSMRRQLEASLRRLKTDYIDVLITHHQNDLDPLDETIDTLEAFIKEGKIRSYGASNVEIKQLEDYLMLGHPIMIQDKWSPLDTSNGKVGDYARSKDVFFQAYSPLERGLLTGNVAPEDTIEGRAKKSDPWFTRENIEKINSALFPLLGIASSYGVSLSAVMLSYMISTHTLFGVCVGARRPFQIEESAKALDLKLSSEEIDRVERAITEILN